MVNVLLLRQPSEDVADTYEDHFRNAGYHHFSLPALETSYVNLPGLSDLVRDGLRVRGFTGVILTSQRSCEALGKAFGLLKDQEELKPRAFTKQDSSWDGVPIYVVGEKTASCLRDIFAQFTDNPGSIDIRGQESGNAANLATFILSDVHDGPGVNLLYLTGDKNRDTMTRMLLEGNINLEPLQVYRTQESLSFEGRLLSILEDAPADTTHWWIVYFAPSTANFVTPMLKKYFDLQDVDPGTPNVLTNLFPTRIAALGPTTHQFLVHQLRLRVDALAQKPTPKDLVSALENVDRSSLKH